MSGNVSEYMLRRLLQDWGVTRIFGDAGDRIIGRLGALCGEAGNDRPEFVQSAKQKLEGLLPGR
jgi:thiamine pyrophosphate-dependent acetolactate synthase large subunit-like protein